MTSPDPLRPSNISYSPELVSDINSILNTQTKHGTINQEMLNGPSTELALSTNLNEMMTSSDLPGPTELVSDVTSILNTPTKPGAINQNAPKLLSDVNMATCSPEMLNGSSAEINTRVRATNLNQTVDHSYLYVTCGTVMGKLHKDKFYCPGIHMQCIELDGGEMTTPRKMVTIADKERLKDWKTAVRVNGMPIRRFMERGLLDFHEHATTCTMKCLSRAGQPRDRESTSPLGMQTLTTSELADTMAPSLHLLQDSGPLSPDYESGESPPSPVPVKLVQVPLATTTSAVLIKPEYDYPAATSTPSSNGGRTKRRRKQVPTSMVQLDESKLPKKRIGAEFDAAELGLFQENEDCQVFWKGILRVGMLDQIVQDIVNEIQGLKKDLVMSGVGREEARQFSKIVKQLGMSQKIQNKVLSQKSTMQKEKEQLKKEMDELKRRVAAAEQRQYDLKRKAASLDQLMDFTLKRPALMTNFAFGVDSDSDNEHLQPAYANFVKNEVMEEGASSDTGSFTSHVEQDGDSPTQSNELFLGPEPKRNRRKNANMLENVLKKLKENTS